MVEIEQVARWLIDSDEGEAAQLAKSCSLNWTWVGVFSEPYGEGEWDRWDVSIEAPADGLKLVRGNQSSLGKIIEKAVRQLAEAQSCVSVRDIRWAPKAMVPQETPWVEPKKFPQTKESCVAPAVAEPTVGIYRNGVYRTQETTPEGRVVRRFIDGKLTAGRLGDAHLMVVDGYDLISDSEYEKEWDDHVEFTEVYGSKVEWALSRGPEFGPLTEHQMALEDARRRFRAYGERIGAEIETNGWANIDICLPEEFTQCLRPLRDYHVGRLNKGENERQGAAIVLDRIKKDTDPVPSLTSPWMPQALRASVEHWGALRDAIRSQMADRPLVEQNGDRQRDIATGASGRFPERGAWLAREMKARQNMTPYRLHKAGGPDPKTVKRILSCERVREAQLELVAAGLSHEGPKVARHDIPDC